MTRCAEFLSSLRTLLTASTCSNILSTMSYVEPQRVTTSTFNLRIGRPFCSCATTKSLCFFQLRENAATALLHTLRPRCTLLSFSPYLVRTHVLGWFYVLIVSQCDQCCVYQCVRVVCLVVVSYWCWLYVYWCFLVF